jgi:hypothetical protein
MGQVVDAVAKPWRGALVMRGCRSLNWPIGQGRRRIASLSALVGRAGGWIWNLHDTRRVVYRLPRVRQAAEKGERVFVAEGEKDVEALEAAGVIATCNPGGAGEWRDAYLESLRGAGEVIVVADRDEAGIEHGLAIVASVRRIVGNVRIVLAKEGQDASDHLEAGETVETFVPYVARRDPRDLSDLTVDAILAANPEVTREELLDENPRLKALMGSKATSGFRSLQLVSACRRGFGVLLLADWAFGFHSR